MAALQRSDRPFWTFSLVGAAVAAVILALAVWLNHLPVDDIRLTVGTFQVIALVLCPPSLGTMAVNSNTPMGMQVLVAAEVVLMNAVLYGVIGLVLCRIKREIAGG